MRMMQQIPEMQKSIRMTTTFGGYNHAEIINDGEMYDTKNLSGDLYPVLTTRKQRGITSFDAEGNVSVPLTGIHGRDQLVFIRGQQVYYNLYPVTGLTVSADPGMMPKKIVSMGAYVIIWPDKVYFNTIDLSDYGYMEHRAEISGQDVTACMCRMDGTNYDMSSITQNDSPPESPSNGDLWLDTSGDNDVLKQYSATAQDWIEVPTVYVKIEGTGIGSGFQEYDSVEISGIAAPSQMNPRTKAQADALNGSKIVYAAGQNYIVVVGLLNVALNVLENQTVTIVRSVPDLDFVCESNNRLWGCKYGLLNGAVVNEIRASKLGDFKNWNSFMGLSTDSYVASIGTDGPWTGAISQRGYPVFFKENAIHRVSGQTPATFGIQTTTARGVQKGSWRSVAVVNENIYYKSRDGVMLYDGNMPISVSEQLGGIMYSDARGGTLKDKYYLNMKDAESQWHLFTYDTKRSIWYREDNLHALGFASVQDELYAIDEDNNTIVSMAGTLLTTSSSTGSVEEEPEWMAVFGLSGLDYQASMYGKSRGDVAGAHYLSRFDIRMYLEEGKSAKLEIMYDSSGEWTEQGTIRGSRMKSFLLPVIPRRCDHLRFRLKGNGEMRIYSIARYMEVGGDG